MVLCEKKLAPKSKFDRRSFRWKTSGKARVLVACPKGHWRRGRCTVGLRAYKLLTPPKAGRCPVGTVKLRKK